MYSYSRNAVCSTCSVYMIYTPKECLMAAALQLAGQPGIQISRCFRSIVWLRFQFVQGNVVTVWRR
jgi:hypothetical protein